VRVEGVSVTYRTTFERRPTFKSALVRFGRGERAVKEVQAVQDISFEVAHGTTLGVIGANGAGKATLVRTTAGILPPTKGQIEVHGRVSTLLALGVGFNPALSGRENVILGGLAAGLSRKEIEHRYETSPSSLSCANSSPCQCAPTRPACTAGWHSLWPSTWNRTS
jgi:ABC-type polysaccharide/polyol phosphate transport system ATPase subunit